jgi:hypothetical protein
MSLFGKLVKAMSTPRRKKRLSSAQKRKEALERRERKILRMREDREASYREFVCGDPYPQHTYGSGYILRGIGDGY